MHLIEDGGARARVLMGSLWGATAATPQHSPTIYAAIELFLGVTGGVKQFEGDGGNVAVVALAALPLAGCASRSTSMAATTRRRKRMPAPTSRRSRAGIPTTGSPRTSTTRATWTRSR